MKNFLISNDSLIKAMGFAEQIAKQTGGRIATSPDIALLRTHQDLETLTWHCWAIPATTLYIGTHKDKRLLVVANHFGPLNTEERWKEWEASGEKDEGSDREKYGTKGCPKITQEEFDSLVDGKYGEVKVIDFDKHYSPYRKHLEGGSINLDELWDDKLLEAILSNNPEDYKLFLAKCHQISKKFAEDENKEEGAAEKILELSIEDRYGCGLWNPYHETVTFPEVPIAFTLLFQRPSFYGNHDLSVSTELHSSESLGYAQFIVLNDENEDIVNLKFNPAKDWKKCMVLNEESFDETFFSLVGSDDSKKLFVEYQKPKDGSYMDTGEQMFPLSEVKKIGGPTTFKTDNCLFFLKYHIDEVRKIAPEGANAYVITGDVQGRDNVTVPIQFYHAVPITNQRILRSKEVMDNLNLLLEINNILIPA